MKNIKNKINQVPIRRISSSKPSCADNLTAFGSSFNNVCEVIKKIKPYIPVYLYRSKAVKDSSKWFVKNFKGFKSLDGKSKYVGKTLFSVKSNSDNRVIKDVFESGVVDFDVASFKEVRQINSLFGDRAKSYFMHPVKSKEAIAESYFNYSVKDFSFDSLDELEKIEKATKGAKDLSLHLRIKMDCESAAIALSGKFGIDLNKSGILARRAKGVAEKFGVCFHVGSQCMDPNQYKIAIKEVAKFFADLGIEVDSFDIGGGFPANYPGMKTKSISEYLKVIKNTIAEVSLKKGCEILCEPGRALVAEAESLLVRVEAKKGNCLYINDGSYGGLFDAGILGFSYFCDAFKPDGKKIESKRSKKYSFYGPTCDSLDSMKGPFSLPAEIEVGDYIEIYNLGAYSKNLRTSFNGYDDIFQFSVKGDIDHSYKQQLD